MASIGKWSGAYIGGWAGGGVPPSGFIDAALFAEGFGFSTFSALLQQPEEENAGIGYYGRRPQYLRAKRIRRDNEALFAAIIN